MSSFQLGGWNMKRKPRGRNIIGVILMGCLLIHGCGIQETTPEMIKETMPESQVESIESEQELLPKIEECVKYPYYYMCYFLDYGQEERVTISDYKASLQEKGFIADREETVEGITYQRYSREHTQIRMVELGDALVLSFVANQEELEKEETEISIDHAYWLIQKAYQERQQMDDSKITNDVKPEVIIKCAIPDLYEKTKLQAYKALTKEGREVGTYLVTSNQAYGIKDSLEQICIADLNQNGVYEVLSLYGYGSGIYRIELNAYEYANPIWFDSYNEVIYRCYSNCFVPKKGAGQLALEKQSDWDVHLTEETKETDYGSLILEEEKVRVKENESVPFLYYEWDQCFQEKETEKDQLMHFTDEVPELLVTVGERTLENKAWKEIWGEEKEEMVQFSELMDDETSIPRFAAPKDVSYGYEEELCFAFPEGVRPKKIQVQDYLITPTGEALYNKAGVIERELRYGEDGKYYLGLMQHFAQCLSSSTETYLNPSYRGFRVQCQFDEKHSCEYVFVLSMKPLWDEP